ncbi:hypothetical protein ABW20_dc0109392 [Dactylellina cionopaga]|nr:hypothetical protein ABW20_dc0109392 [Dactylellina cionopaga]
MASQVPFSTPSRGSAKANPNTTSISIGQAEASRAPLTRARLSRHPEAEAEWLLGQAGSETPPSQKGPSRSPLSEKLPIQKTFSTAPLARLSDPQKTARAALDHDASQNNRSGRSITDLRDENMAIDPELLALSLGQGIASQEAAQSQQNSLDQSDIGSLILHDDGDSSQSIDGQESALFETSILQPTKRKDINNSPRKDSQPKRLRPMNDIAAELQAPLPPPRAFLPTKGQFQTIATSSGTEIRHRVSLSNIQPGNHQQPNQHSNPASIAEVAPLAVPQNYHFVEYLKKHNQHLEAQLFNRNFENTRQVDEIRRANAYAAQAKNCMRKDGEDINHLRMLLLYAKNKIEIWEKMIEPLAILESPSIKESGSGTQMGQEGTHSVTGNIGIAARIVQDAREVIKNFDKAIKDVHSRPVHQLDEEIESFITFKA